MTKTVDELYVEFARSVDRIPDLTGEELLPVASGLHGAGPVEYVVVKPHSVYQGRTLQVGDRFTAQAEDLATLAKYIKTRTIIPGMIYDASQRWHSHKQRLEEVVGPVWQRYERSEKDLSQAQGLLVAAQAQLKAAQDRLKLARETRAAAEDDLRRVLE